MRKNISELLRVLQPTQLQPNTFAPSLTISGVFSTCLAVSHTQQQSSTQTRVHVLALIAGVSCFVVLFCAWENHYMDL